MDSQKLAEMVATIKERNMNVHSLLVIRNGYLVSETYFDALASKLAPCDLLRHQELRFHTCRYRVDKGAIDGVDHQS